MIDKLNMFKVKMWGAFPTDQAVECFNILIDKINEITDHINNQQPKKPKSTNIALRQRIAELEKENVELKRKLKKQDDEDNLYDSFLKKLPLFADK